MTEAVALFETWVHPWLSDPRVTDICVIGARKAFIDRGEGMQPIPVSGFDEAHLKFWVLRQLSAIDRSWDARFPFMDFTLAYGQSQFRGHVTFEPMCREGLLVSLRRLAETQSGQKRSWHGSPVFEELSRAVARGESMVIAGATGSGKTTLASDLLAFVPHHERVIALEDTPELAPDHPHFLSLVSRPPNADGHGEVTLRDLLRQTLRMRPDRIVLGECRGAEVLELLQSLNTGHRGGMATVHAHSARDALRRLELLCHLHDRSPLPSQVIRDLMSSGLRYIVHVERKAGARIIDSVHEIAGIEGSTVLLRPLVRSVG